MNEKTITFLRNVKLKIFIIYHWSIDYYPKDHNNMIFLNFSCLFTFYGCSKSEFLTKDPTWAFEKTKCLWTKIALLVVSKSINIWIFIISWKKSGATIFEAILHPQIMQVCGGQNSLKKSQGCIFPIIRQFLLGNSFENLTHFRKSFDFWYINLKK